MKLIVLAGGFGTRLRTVVPDVPKSLAPVGNVPFLQIQLENWLKQGMCEFTFLLHHQADQIIAFLKEQLVGLLKDCEVKWLVEPAPMGTGGAIAHAVRELELSGDFIITNADTWISGGIYELMHVASPAIAVVYSIDVSRYGGVLFDDAARIYGFSEKKQHSESGWINAGLYRINAEIFKDWDGRPFSLERDLFVSLVGLQSLKAIPLQIDFIDIGVPEDYYRFCRWIKAGQKTSL